MTSSCPFIYPAAGEARYTAVPAISDALRRAAETTGMPTRSTMSVSMTSCVISLSYTPGAIAFTRTEIRFSANSVASIFSATKRRCVLTHVTLSNLGQSADARDVDHVGREPGFVLGAPFQEAKERHGYKVDRGRVHREQVRPLLERFLLKEIFAHLSRILGSDRRGFVKFWRNRPCLSGADRLDMQLSVVLFYSPHAVLSRLIERPLLACR